MWLVTFFIAAKNKVEESNYENGACKTMIDAKNKLQDGNCENVACKMVISVKDKISKTGQL